MNYRGSYRHLVRNSVAALTAAVEIYNKPRFSYRDECFSILLLNAWELLLKAMLSKRGKSIFYPKKRKAPYRTLSLSDALKQVEPLLPVTVSPVAIKRNVELLGTYRDNAVHFYNESEFGSVLAALGQTSIVNFKDVLAAEFRIDLSKEVTWQLMPLALSSPVDPIAFISGTGPIAPKKLAVKQFLGEVSAAVKDVEAAGQEVGRLLTVFKVKLESTKKISEADVVVGIQKGTADMGGNGPLAILKTVDPNVSHPLRQTEVVEAIKELHGISFTGYVFQAVAWKHELKAKPELCWKASEGVLVRYANDVVAWLKRLSKGDLATALTEYRAHIRGIRRTKR